MNNHIKRLIDSGNYLIETGVICEKCGAPMAIKCGPRGPFYACIASPECRCFGRDETLELIP